MVKKIRDWTSQYFNQFATQDFCNICCWCLSPHDSHSADHIGARLAISQYSEGTQFQLQMGYDYQHWAFCGFTHYLWKNFVKCNDFSYLLTPNSMEQSPQKASQLWASQEISYIVWNLKVHYCIYKSLPPVRILSQINLVHSPPSHLLKIHLNISLLSMSGYSKWSLSSGFPTKTLYVPLLSLYMLHATPISLLDLITWIIFSEEYRSLSPSLCSFLHSPITSSLSGPNILLSTVFCNALSLRSSLNVSYQVSHPYYNR